VGSSLPTVAACGFARLHHTMSNLTSTDFRPIASWSNLRLRADLLRQLRQFFDARGFLEVETPILSADTVVDRHLDPFYTDISPLPTNFRSVPGEGTGRRMWLQTSPEFAMKRMLAAGGGPIYQVARVFRLDEIGPLHNPEFTLVEWYQPGDGMDAGMQLTSDLCETLLNRGASGKISYHEAFERYVGINPHTTDGKTLAAVTKRLGIEAPASLALDDRDGWLDLLMVERIQPHLGVKRPALLYDYPASQAALARIRPTTAGDKTNPPVAERFELYIDGIELANGYHELLDPAELRARNTQVNAQRVADGKSALPDESRLLAAMAAGLPAAVGVALGFDRLVMLAVGAKSIAEVVAFPFDRA
jgi:elongation factor P--(R)-beta-lysine ligase